jgi:ferredoxin-type protein NapH
MVAMTKDGTSTLSAKLIGWRSWVQAVFLLAWLDPFALRLHTVCGPVFHCYSCPLATFACPIGVLANFSALHLVPFMAVGLLVAVGSLLGSFVCGWVCPFGFLQDMVGRIPVRKFELPAWTGYLRYVVLVGLVLVIPFFFGEGHPLFICRVCPAGALEGAVPNIADQALAILGLFLVGMFIKFRPWCTLFCPLGAVYSLFNRVSLFFLKLDADRCTNCNLCHDVCNHGVRPNERANDPRCIRCLECSKCGAITITHVFSERKTESRKAGIDV